MCRRGYVSEGGLEPPRPCGHQPLKLARLPIPPLRQIQPAESPRLPPRDLASEVTHPVGTTVVVVGGGLSWIPHCSAFQSGPAHVAEKLTFTRLSR
jgi:hypothetical protein